MTNSKTRYTEQAVNAHLALLPADKRPELSTRRRAQSVAYSCRGFYEVTDSDNHTVTVLVGEVKSWLSI